MDTLPLNTSTATSVNMDTLPLNTCRSTTAVNTTSSVSNSSLGTNAQPLRVRLPPKDSMLPYVNDEKLTQREDLTKSPVINELLCFAHNRLQRLPVDFVVKLCVGFYSDDEIYIAKRTLYDTIEGKRKNCGRYKKHIGPNKGRDDLIDIMTVLRSIELSDMPVFAARDLCNLPPLIALDTYVVGLYREVDKLKQGFDVIKSFQHDIEELSNQMHKLSKASLEKSAGKRIAHAAVNTEGTQESHIGTEGNISCIEINVPATELSEPNKTNTHKSVSRRNAISDVITSTESKNDRNDNDVTQHDDKVEEDKDNKDDCNDDKADVDNRDVTHNDDNRDSSKDDDSDSSEDNDNDGSKDNEDEDDSDEVTKDDDNDKVSQATNNFDNSLSGSFVVIDSISDNDSDAVSDDPVNSTLVKRQNNSLTPDDRSRTKTPQHEISNKTQDNAQYQQQRKQRWTKVYMRTTERRQDAYIPQRQHNNSMINAKGPTTPDEITCIMKKASKIILQFGSNPNQSSP